MTLLNLYYYLLLSDREKFYFSQSRHVGNNCKWNAGRGYYYYYDYYSTFIDLSLSIIIITVIVFIFSLYRRQLYLLFL